MLSKVSRHVSLYFHTYESHITIVLANANAKLLSALRAATLTLFCCVLFSNT